MSSNRPSIFARDDTMFGVCEGLGEDLGINANLLRVALALALFWNPLTTAGVYAGAGLLVAVLRLLIPDPPPAAPAAEAAAAEDEPAEWRDFADAA